MKKQRTSLLMVPILGLLMLAQHGNNFKMWRVLIGLSGVATLTPPEQYLTSFVPTASPSSSPSGSPSASPSAAPSDTQSASPNENDVPKREQTSIYPINQAICPPKANLSIYSPTKLVKPPKEQNDWNRCFRFQCNRNITECDNSDYPTNYNGTRPPCCTHILRDFAIEIDRIMCHYGIEYYPSFGMLLSLTREDRFIPWTSDNDFVLTYQGIAFLNEIWDRSDQELNHGLRLLFDLGVTRVCAGPDFAHGQLQKWSISNSSSNNNQKYYDVCPYNDLYHSKDLGNGKWKDALHCQHSVRDSGNTSLPMPIRKPVYNGSFYLNMLQGAEETLEFLYGENWRTPASSKKPHGSTNCRYRNKKRVTSA